MLSKFMDAKDESVLEVASLNSEPHLGDLLPVAGRVRLVVRVEEQIDGQGRLYNAVYLSPFI